MVVLANNQLRAGGQDGQEKLAKYWTKTGISFVVKCMYNMAGV